MVSNGKPRIIVFGNGTLDIYVVAEVQIGVSRDVNDNVIAENAKVSIKSDWGSAEFIVEDPPIVPGNKHRVNEDLETIVMGSGLLHRYAPGGGGINTITALKQLQDGHELLSIDLDLTYLDVSNPDWRVVEGLRRAEITKTYYFWRREMPTNLVLKLEDDRIVLKGPQLRRYSPRPSDAERIEQYVAGSDALFINGAKDQGYVELFIQIAQQFKVPVVTEITPSLPWSFAYEKVLPSGMVVLNYEDLAEMKGLKSQIDTQATSRKEARRAYIDLALETLEDFRRLNPDKDAFITLGPHGVAFSNSEGIFQVELNPEYAARVAAANNGNPGAGDYFFANAAFSKTFLGRSSLETAIYASKTAINHIGFWGSMPREAFRVQTLSRSLRAA